jgi:putative ABC transport system permease protein
LLPVAEFRSIRDLKAQSLEQQRLMAILVDAFGALAILLVALGIYGLAANLAADKTRELGIRLALGSTAPQAVWTALNPALRWVLGGVIAGAAAAVATERFLRSFLWGVRPLDPPTLAAVAFGLLAATALASLLPAARIVRLNPADTLRAE